METTTFSLIKSTLNAFINNVKSEFKDEIDKISFKKISSNELKKNVKEFNKSKFPKFIVYQLKSQPEYLFFITNQTDGWYTLLNCISINTNCEIYRINLHDEESSFEPSFTFSYLHKGRERLVLLYKEADKWVFFEKGTPLAFEKIQLYKERIKKNRLSNKIILEYLSNLGVPNKINFLDDIRGEIIFFEQKKW